MHSNSYTIIFTSIVTIILGFFLSVLAGSLGATQKANIDNDIKKNILVSLGYKPANNNLWTSDYIQELFDNNIDAFVMDKNGKRTLEDPKSIDTENDIENLPIYVNRQYCIPKWVNKNTLVIICSYSGNTEETISSLIEVEKLGVKPVNDSVKNDDSFLCY